MVNETNLEQQTHELLTYDVKEAVISSLSAQAHAIVVSSWEDEENCKAARKLRTEIRAVFEKVDRRRKDLKNFIDKKGKEVTSQIEESIKYLDSQIAIRDNELKRQKEEAEKARQAIVNERSRLLTEEGFNAQLFLLDPEACSEEKFVTLLEQARNDKLLRIQAEKRAEEERLKAEAEQKAKDAELEVLRAQNKLLEKKVELSANIEAAAVASQTQPEEDSFRLMTLLKKYPTELSKVRRIAELEDQVALLQSQLPEEDLELF